MDDTRKWCCFHPEEMVVGVCALCLNEKLLVLSASKRINKTNNIYGISPRRVLAKILSLNSLFNHRLDVEKKKKTEVYQSSSTSPEESFISIKFGDNGVALWDEGKTSNDMPPDQSSSNEIKKMKTVQEVEQLKQRRALSMRWRKRIGRLFQLIKWKRSRKS